MSGAGTIEGPFFYVYKVGGRSDGMVFAFAHSELTGRDGALFASAVDAQRWADMLRAAGERVSVMPSAEGIVS